MGAAADAHVTTDTQALSLHQTRALTTPMPVEERLVAAAAAVGIPDRKDADRSSRDRQKVISSRIRPLTQVSTGAQLVFLALLVLIVVACVGLVINSAGEGTPVRDQAPDVPGKIGRDLQSLHDAVYP